MIDLIKKHWVLIVTISITMVIVIYLYGCEPKVKSLNATRLMVTRAELQLELEHIINTANLRMIDLDKQDRLRSLIVQNALVLVQGQPLNPLGLITAMAAVYGLGSVGSGVNRVVKKVKLKRVSEVNNGTV